MKEIHLDKTQEQEIVAKKMQDKTYFKDGLNWYFSRYLSPISERANLLVIVFILLFSSLIVFKIVKSTFPLKESVSIALSERDSAEYIPLVQELNADRDKLDNVNEAVSRYLVKEYIVERESFDYSAGDIEVYNRKLFIIQNNSSTSIFKDFKESTEISNEKSPLKYFGKEITRDVEVIGFQYIRSKPKGFVNTMKNIFTINKASNRAVVVCKVVTKTLTKTITEVKRVQVSFYFNGIQRSRENKKFLPIKFFITEYKYL